MGQFSQLFNIFKPLVTDGMTFLQSMSVLIAGCMATWYKLREMVADVQEDQMFSQKNKKVFACLIFIFIIPTIIKIVQSYVNKG